MTDLLVRVMALPHKSQKRIAFLLVLIVAGSLVIVLATLYRTLADKSASIEKLRENIAQLQNIVAKADNLSTTPGAQTPVDLYFQGATLSSTQAAIQSTVSSFAAENNAVIQTTTAINSDDRQLASIAVTMVGSNQSIVRTLAAIERTKPFLLLRDLTMSANDPTRDELFVQITVVGFLLEETKP